MPSLDGGCTSCDSLEITLRTLESTNPSDGSLLNMDEKSWASHEDCCTLEHSLTLWLINFTLRSTSINEQH